MVGAEDADHATNVELAPVVGRLRVVSLVLICAPLARLFVWAATARRTGGLLSDTIFTGHLFFAICAVIVNIAVQKQYKLAYKPAELGGCTGAGSARNSRISPGCYSIFLEIH